MLNEFFLPYFSFGHITFHFHFQLNQQTHMMFNFSNFKFKTHLQLVNKFHSNSNELQKFPQRSPINPPIRLDLISFVIYYDRYHYDIQKSWVHTMRLDTGRIPAGCKRLPISYHTSCEPPYCISV